MSKKKKVVITGGTGLLGCSGALKLKDKWEMSLWSRGYTGLFPWTTSRIVALEDLNSINAALDLDTPDVLIHAAGMTNVDDCEKNHYRSYISNVITTKLLAKACDSRGIKFVYISTDHLTADKEASTELEIGFPVNVYAKTKLEGEFEALNINPNSLIVRTNFVTWGNAHRKSFIDFIVDNLREKKNITLFEDVRFNPLTAELLLSYVDDLVTKGESGIFNLSADDKMSKYDFGMLVAKIFELDSSVIIKGQLKSNKELTKRPANLTTDNSKLKSVLGIKSTPSILGLVEGLKREEKYFKSEFEKCVVMNPSKKIIHYGRQMIDDQDFESLLVSLDSNWLTQGPKVVEFEKAIANYAGAKYAVAMANWTCGLHMAVLAAGVGPGDYVITSPLSFVASSNCAVYVGAIPYFVDIDPKTLNLDPVKLKEACQKLGKKLKAIIPVHFAGAPCDMEKISAIAKDAGAVLIEDAAHALGGRYTTGEKIGNCRYSDMVGFSFHPVKNITTGEGGMILTDDVEIYRRLLRIRSHGITKENDKFFHPENATTKGLKNGWYYEMQEVGFNFRITDLQCALGLSQLGKIEKFASARLKWAKIYDQELPKLKNLKVMQDHLRDYSGNHLYVVKIDFARLKMARSELYAKFEEKGILLHLHYIPIYRQPFYEANYKVDLADFKNTEKYYEEVVTFPLYSSMTQEEMERILTASRELIG